MTSSKRLDLQGLRGVAISTVLLFHFFPQSFPNGYIGVDMFFVLSGLLISVIFSKSGVTLATVYDFYFRRMKRILPLYLLLLLSTTIFVSIAFRSEYLEENVESAWNALLIYTNIANASPDKAYAPWFVGLSEASDAFTHTWSLAVEIQFYALVPIVFVLIATLGAKIVIILVASSSIFYGLLIDAFNSVLARLWQFHIGIAANRMSIHLMKTPEVEGDCQVLLGDRFKREDTQKRQTGDVLLQVCLYAFILTVISQSLYLQVIPPFLLRCSTTFVTGVIILLGSELASSNCLLTNRLVVYMGDISYALYLVHWPIYLYIKEYNYCYMNVLLGIFISILLAIIVTESYEKFYLQLDRHAVFFLICALFIANVILLSTLKRGMGLSAKLRTNYSNLTQEQIIDLNSLWTSRFGAQLSYDQCSYRTAPKPNTAPIGWCDLPVSAAHSAVSHSLMVIGNSWAANDISAVHHACKDKVSNITLYWQMGCEVLVETKVISCTEGMDNYLESIREQRPDSLIILTRHFKLLQGSAQLIKDEVYDEARKMLSEIEKLVRKSIYLLQPIPVPHGPLAKLVNNHLKTGKNITDAELAFLPVEVGRLRLSALAADCEKCRILDYMPSLSNENGEFQFYDPTSSLIYLTPGHLSPLAIQNITPVFEEVCRHL